MSDLEDNPEAQELNDFLMDFVVQELHYPGMRGAVSIMALVDTAFRSTGLPDSITAVATAAFFSMIARKAIEKKLGISENGEAPPNLV